MTIAEQIKSFYLTINPATGSESFDTDGLLAEAEEKSSDVDQDWENGTTTFEFADGSVMVCELTEVKTYACKQ